MNPLVYSRVFLTRYELRVNVHFPGGLSESILIQGFSWSRVLTIRFTSSEIFERIGGGRFVVVGKAIALNGGPSNTRDMRNSGGSDKSVSQPGSGPDSSWEQILARGGWAPSKLERLKKVIGDPEPLAWMSRPSMATGNWPMATGKFLGE